MKKRAKKAVKHGYVGTNTYQSWRGMKSRCHHKKSTQWEWYGARGIAVCDRWRYNFLDFLADMGEAPSADHSIDRIDCNGNYEPGNCRWATHDQQQVNKRQRKDSALLIHNGETLSVTEWANKLGINRHTIFSRVRQGFTTEEILSREGRKAKPLTTPTKREIKVLVREFRPKREADKTPAKHSALLTYEGQTLSVTEWAKSLGINRATIFARLRLGWSTEAALFREVQPGVSPNGWRKP